MNANRRSFAFGFLGGVLGTLLVGTILVGGMFARSAQKARMEAQRAEQALRDAQKAQHAKP